MTFLFIRIICYFFKSLLSISSCFLSPSISSRIPTSKNSDISTKIEISGILIPFSQRDTDRFDTPSCSANCSCVIPFSLRNSRSKHPIFFLLHYYALLSISILLLLFKQIHDTKQEYSHMTHVSKWYFIYIYIH